MKKIVVCFAVMLMALALQAQAGVEKSIAAMEQQWTVDGKSGNADGVAPMLADNFTNMDSDGSMHNRAETLARIKAGKWDVNEIGDVKVNAFGNTAVATGTWHGKGMSEGKAVDARERWVDTWMKMPNGKWQCIASASAPAKM